MNRMSHAEQHQDFPPGTAVIAADGEQLGVIRTVSDHFLLVRQEDTPLKDLEVPVHAIVSYDGERLRLSVNRRALSIVDADVAVD